MAARVVAGLVLPGLTALDLIGPLQVLDGLSRVRSDLEIVTVAGTREPVQSDAQVSLSASHLLEEVRHPDAVLVPGGAASTVQAMDDERVLDWLRTAAVSSQRIVSVCTGSLLLGAAGLLTGRRATCHWAFAHLLPRFGAEPVEGRWVDDGPVTTAAAVSAGLDVAFQLARDLGSAEEAAVVAQMLEYDPRPPIAREDWPTRPPGFAEELAASVIASALPVGSPTRTLLWS